MGARGKKISGYIKPMLTTAVDHAFTHKEWIFELKFDGFRAIADFDGKTVQLYSRNGLDLSDKFPAIVTALRKFKAPVTFDGEIVVLNEKGNPDFQKLQNYKDNKQYPLVYYAFDMLRQGNQNLMKLTLIERKKLLKKLVSTKGMIRYSAHISGKGENLFDTAVASDLEGIIAKKKESVYTPGLRTKEWLKIKYHKSQEAIIVGYTEPQGSRTGFGALILAEYAGKKLNYIGHAGTGFTQKALKELVAKMKPLIRKKSPLTAKLPSHSPVTWLKPSLVCEVSYAEVTRDGMLRQAVYKGLRTEKKVSAVQKKTEVPSRVEKIVKQKK